ncbi:MULTISPECIES: hypothetical protein [unclassified Wenzhouxiangella]|uniref:hypothetical protein n=1 Tax=unclassified Wenzhouxiangella TaxID=2613841 RepID=UPI0011C05AB4|nr:MULTISPECIES: hypothetical protein [unclassified Wenzhouxiangella]
MQLSEALFHNIQKLSDQAAELREREEEIRKSGSNAQTTIDLLVSTCEEIGRLNDALKRELDGLRA